MNQGLSIFIFVGGIFLFAFAITALSTTVKNKKYPKKLREEQVNTILTNLFGDNASNYHILSCQATINPESLLKLAGKSMAMSVGSLLVSGGRFTVNYQNDYNTYMVIYGNKDIILVPAYYDTKEKQIKGDFNKMMVFNSNNISELKYSVHETTIILKDKQKVRFGIESLFLGKFNLTKKEKQHYKDYICSYNA